MDKYGDKFIKYIIRDAKNGRRYIYKYPTLIKIKELVNKYGIDQFVENEDGSYNIWLQY